MESLSLEAKLATLPEWRTGIYSYFAQRQSRVQVTHSLVPRPSYHGVPVRGPGNNGLRMRLIKTARYA